MNKVDLHTHTTASDGMFPPAMNVKLAKEAGLHGLAITDHDTVAGVPEALLAGAELGIAVVPGVEISTSEQGKDIHILGYGISIDDPDLLLRLQALRNTRNRRNEEILTKLAELDMRVTLEELESAAGKSSQKEGSIGRPHIARALMDKGYVTDIREAFDRYLGEGMPAYASLARISPFEAIRWIHEAGGIAIIAHPGLYDMDELVLALLDTGEADGLEAFHSDHDREMERRYEEWALSRGKITTGGSDFHGIKDGIAFHGTLGSRWTDKAIVDRLIKTR